MPIHLRVENDGFEGIFYQGRDPDKKALIVMSGSNGGLSLTRKEAEFRNFSPCSCPLSNTGYAKGTVSYSDRVCGKCHPLAARTGL